MQSVFPLGVFGFLFFFIFNSWSQDFEMYRVILLIEADISCFKHSFTTQNNCYTCFYLLSILSLNCFQNVLIFCSHRLYDLTKLHFWRNYSGSSLFFAHPPLSKL